MTRNKYLALLPVLVLCLMFSVDNFPAAAKSKAEETVAEDSFGQEVKALSARHHEERQALIERQRAEREQLHHRYGRTDDIEDDTFDDSEDSEDRGKDKNKDQGKDQDDDHASKGKSKDKDDSKDSKGKNRNKGKPGKE